MVKRLVPLVALLFALASGARAQTPDVGKALSPVALAARKGIQKHYVYGGADHPTPPPGFGLLDGTWSRLGATELDPDGSGTTFTSTWAPEFAEFTYQRYVTGGYPHLIGFAHVPGGALIDIAGITYCETNASGPFGKASWYLCDDKGSCATPPFATVDFGAWGTGCQEIFVFDLTETMNNYQSELLVDVTFAHTDGTESVASINFRHKLQISPPPPSPTFSDVPVDDTAFPFVEALVKAGITVGCDAGPPARYCPDDPLTRRQMAVFISKALGLDWTGY
ncbi:MAG TPA: hypothetical protein VGH97_06885 [Thermoanaerobaculia bacterium]